MHRVLLTGGRALVRDAYARVIGASAGLTLQAQTPRLPDALAQLPSLRPDLLLIDADALPDRPVAASRSVLRQATAWTRLAVIGTIPTSDIVYFVRAGFTGILGRDIEAAHFVTALDLVSGEGWSSPLPAHRSTSATPAPSPRPRRWNTSPAANARSSPWSRPSATTTRSPNCSA